jgi:hypothetical protein
MRPFALTILLCACVEAATPPASPQPPEPKEDTWTPQSPQKAWWKEPSPCPEGASLVGEPPPKGQAVECLDASGKRNGLSSIWFGSGHAGTMTEYKAGVPDGEWLYWVHGQKLIEGRHVQGRREGRWTYWFDDSASFDTESRMATHDWRQNYVVEEYDHGLLVSTKQFQDGKEVK